MIKINKFAAILFLFNILWYW